ncbi:hypothetical protein AJ80_03080 [Polytolypa hystricis UAMH7299]|uniref:Mediator of RNA polymerase II transcription subunit 20 n=1 Tax=Polytolypa hystricis (strain UAMH7299) TaxID=1447883 RepID=A0A2B7YLZ5_POLH7|nr:hypothetical protein AJ80_03080 [Polytolypa hystricis UAMH7299]
MPVTGVYFIPANPNSPSALATVVDRLREAYDPTITGRWGLEHKLLRDTASCLPPSAYVPLPKLQPRFMQFLSLSHYPTHGFVYTSDRVHPDPWATTGTGTGTATGPTGQQTHPQITHNSHQQQPPFPTTPAKRMMTMDPPSYTSFYTLTLQICEPLWCPRHTVTVPSGIVFEVSDFRIRIGDVRQTAPVTRVRGTIVEIEYRGPSSNRAMPDVEALLEQVGPHGIMFAHAQQAPATSSAAAAAAADTSEPFLTDEDWTIGETLIREFWSRFAIEGAREAIRVPDLGKESREAQSLGKTRLTTAAARPGNNGITGVDLARQYMEVLRFNR